MKKNTRYKPNKVSSVTRLFSIVGAFSLLVYGGYGIYVNDLFIPLKRHSAGMHLDGGSAWFMYAAFICAAVILLSFVVDHYDKRDNEEKYKKFSKNMQYVGWGFFVLSLVSYLIPHTKAFLIYKI